MTTMRALAVCLIATALAAIPPRAPHPSRRAESQTEHPSHRSARPQQDDHIPKAQAADAYAIYSLLMPGKLFAHIGTAQATRWAIAQKTVTFSEMDPRIDPRGALKPPPNNEEAFHQAVRDFEQSREVSYTLQPRLTIAHPYNLLDTAQVRDLRHAKSGLAPDSRLRARYAAYPGVTFFSAVYFSKNQKAALVYVNDWCGVLCSQGQWVYLEKSNGHWQRKSGITVPGA